jgi:hypothetical protein
MGPSDVDPQSKSRKRCAISPFKERQGASCCTDLLILQTPKNLLGPSREADISEGWEREVLLLKASLLVAYVVPDT